MPIRPWQRCNDCAQLAARKAGAHQRGITGGMNAMQRKGALCQIDFNRYDSHEFPFASELMKSLHFPLRHFVVGANSGRERLFLSLGKLEVPDGDARWAPDLP